MSFNCLSLANSENFLVKSDNNSRLKPSGAKISSSNGSSLCMACRICQTNSSNEILISPCSCKGTLAYVHLSCLERWLNQSCRNYCELCKFHYDSIETLRYGLLESLRVWIRHPRNQAHIRSDLLIGILLTLVTAGLIAVCLCGLDYFVIEGEKIGLMKKWIQLCVALFVLIVIAGYSATVILIVRDQFLPWYHWWRRTVNIQLQIPATVPSIPKCARIPVNP